MMQNSKYTVLMSVYYKEKPEYLSLSIESIPKIEWNVVNLLLDNERHRSLDYIDRILK